MNFVAGVMFNNPRTLTPLQYPEHMIFIRGGSKLFPHSTLQVPKFWKEDMFPF